MAATDARFASHDAGGAAAGVPSRRRVDWSWLGLVPFLAFVLLFLVLPTAQIVLGALQDPQGRLTLDNLEGLAQPSILSAFRTSLWLSAASALIGGLAGFLIAAAVTLGNLPAGLRGPMLSFCGVASNFAGVPLAFAFIATLGRVGLATVLLREAFGVNLYGLGFNLLSFWGLVLVYLYFQIPLMVLVIAPALEGMRREWREAAQSLGASPWQYWRMVALPVLAPSILGAMALLFANAFGAVATAVALTGSGLSIAPILLFNQIRGDVLQNPHLGYAIAFAMIAVTALTNLVYIALRARAARWTR